MSLLSNIFKIETAIGNDKITALKNMPRLKPILKYAYDPFKRYRITPPELAGVEGGHGITRETQYILDSLADGSLSGNQAFEEVCDHIMSLNPHSAEVFKRILKKDLRCGISVKTINKAFPGLIPLVFDGSTKPPFALCKTFPEKHNKFPVLAAVKKDGVRVQYVDNMIGLFDKMIGRSGHGIVGHGHIEKQLTFCVDGELTVPSAACFDVGSGLIRDKNETPGSCLWVFDAPAVQGDKLERYKWLLKNLEQSDNVKLVEHVLIPDMLTLTAFYQKAVSEGEEGIVIYDPESEYKDGRIWWRWVPIKSEDLPVVGFFPGKGKHEGSLGGIIVDYKGHQVKVGTGFTEKVSSDSKLYKTRSEIWGNKKDFLGVIAEIEYKEVTKAGSLRQPRFKRWRFDK